MGRSKLFTQPLHGDNFYHIYGRANGNEKLFLDPNHNHKFLENLKKFVSPFGDTLAFNLLPNHYHLIFYVLKKEELMRKLPKCFINMLPDVCKKLVKADEDNMAEILSNRFKAMLGGYSGHFNHNTHRKGNLMIRPFCRKHIQDVEYLKKAIFYVHANDVRHGLIDNMSQSPWSSFNDAVNKDLEIVSRERLFEIFGGELEMIKYHMKPHKFTGEEEEKFVIEEEDILALIEKMGTQEQG